MFLGIGGPRHPRTLGRQERRADDRCKRSNLAWSRGRSRYCPCESTAAPDSCSNSTYRVGMTVDETFLNKASYLGYRLHVGAGDFQLSLFVGPTRPQSRWPSEQKNYRTTEPQEAQNQFYKWMLCLARLRDSREPPRGRLQSPHTDAGERRGLRR